MDIATLIGAVIGFLVVIFSIVSEGQSTVLFGYMDLSIIAFVVCGSLTCVFMSYTWHEFIKCFRVLGVAMGKRQDKEKKLVALLVDLANQAHRQGLLSLEAVAENQKDTFLKKGIFMIIDGVESHDIRNILQTDISQMNKRYQTSVQFFHDWGSQATAWGMIGSITGFIYTLADTGDLSLAAPGMGHALLSICYGALLANVLCFPAARKIELLNRKECGLKEMMLEGLLSIKAEENPRITEEKVKAFSSTVAQNVIRGAEGREDIHS